LESVGGGSETLKAFGHPETSILGESFYSKAAIRYGEYIAKLSIQPASNSLKDLTGKVVPELGKHYSGLRDEAAEFFADLQKMPVEDPSVEWPEDLSPYLPVARIVARPQNAYSAERRVYVDEKLSFSPWHCLAVHRPLDFTPTRPRANSGIPLTAASWLSFAQSMNSRTEAPGAIHY
jgi:hypothetical protein